jgi:hypothetical protein
MTSAARINPEASFAIALRSGGVHEQESLEIIADTLERARDALARRRG